MSSFAYEIYVDAQSHTNKLQEQANIMRETLAEIEAEVRMAKSIENRSRMVATERS